MRKVMWILLASIIILGMAGCGFKDIDNRFFVVSMGVGKAEAADQIKVIVKLAIPSGETRADESNFIIISEDSETISDAIRIIKSRVDKELDFGHLKAIIFDEELLDQNVEKELDWFLRRRDVQMIAWVAAGRPSAEEVLKIKPKSERLPSNTIFLAFDLKGSESPYTIAKYLFEFYRENKSRGISAIMPVIEAKGDLLEINSSLILDDYKKSALLGREETKMMNLLKNGLENPQFKVKQEKEIFVVSAKKAKTALKLRTPKGKDPVMDISIKVNGLIEEAHTNINDQNLEKYNEALEEEIEADTLALLKKLQDQGADPIGFGLRYRGSHFQNDSEWKEWQEIYQRLRFQVKVSADIQGTGLIE
ncbi:Ger(x)C family spore germination protein [Bacillus sp. ISL-47]|uniref:Ger(x)C family spore germination protein n=1 Tax=Bacillus sp. ISL-47 TaxID=2819130 RepID=UPI001BE7D580|nr:Ger(x)C family spore germination protein [Bacillus sp. ISL-47]MBT2688214.1 Ger(x)C family spore germination protein [Bacillus sp. ISL-47]MBT2710008.1 Ger(x)C family spore germination protein [Pseudomonas sp. ISL-84]